jgi:amino acid adenylation domain-containing protein
LHHFFEQQAALRPQHVAVECNGEKMTYAELDGRANAVAVLLRDRGIRRGALVGLFLKKSSALYVAMLGILKAGAGYVPIDLKFPLARIDAVLADAGVALVLSDGESLRRLDGHVHVGLIDVGTILHGEPDPPAMPVIATTDVCYVIYTSGSTGVPKGVVVEHCNAVHFIRAMQQVYGLSERDRTYQGFSIAFDASVEEVWAAFSHGGTLVVPPEEIAKSTIDAAEFIKTKGITFFSTVPSFLAMMDPSLPSLKLLVLGGEVCPSELIARWHRQGLRILNTYGPTEATVVATVCECGPGQPVTVGFPLPGYEIAIRSEHGTESAPGETGELYIGGPSIARGYMKREELTAERFVLLSTDGGTRRMYRTCDLVRLTESGALQYVGRTDSQVKVRGFRVELSEIEAVLLEHPSIKAVAAKVVEPRGWKEIAVYAVLRDPSATLNQDELRHRVRARLARIHVSQLF